MDAMTYDPEAAAAAGARFLDDRRPDWHANIDEAELRMSSCSGCILGQLEGEYVLGAEALGLRIYAREIVDLGFMIPAGYPYAGGPAWSALRDAWLAEIDRRRP